MAEDNDIKAGEYELLAQWDQITSKPNEPLAYTRHKPGDVVSLDAGTAQRLVNGDAAVKKGERERLANEAATANIEATLASLPDDVRQQLEEQIAQRAKSRSAK